MRCPPQNTSEKLWRFLSAGSRINNEAARMKRTASPDRLVAEIGFVGSASAYGSAVV